LPFLKKNKKNHHSHVMVSCHGQKSISFFIVKHPLTIQYKMIDIVQSDVCLQCPIWGQ
jgi:hypothetical protein